MLCLIIPLPRTPPWATRNLFNSQASPHRLGPLPIPGAAPQVRPPRPHLDCLRVLPPPPCPLDRPQQECILPCPLELLLLSLLLLLDPLALLLELHIHPRGLSRQGSTLRPACPFQSFQGHMVVQQSQQPPLLLLDHGDPCLLEGGAQQWGASTPLLLCHIHPQGHIPLLPRHQGLHLQFHGVQSHPDPGDLLHRPHFRHPLDHTRLLDCTQRHPILTKCHLHLPGLHPCLADLILTVELEVGSQSPLSLPAATIYGHFKRNICLVTFLESWRTRSPPACSSDVRRATLYPPNSLLPVKQPTSLSG